MEGLEATEISYNYVKKSNDVFRFDSTFFQKEFITEESIIRSNPFKTLKDLGVELKSFGAYSLNNDVTYVNSGIPFIRGVNMKKGKITFNDMIYIDEAANSILWKSEVKPEMVLLSMSGTIGDVALASKKWTYPINSNQDIAKIDTKGKINPYYLYAFLLSKFGQNYLKREARGSVQQHVFLSQMELFEIPVFSSTFYERIEQLILESDDIILNSESLYQQAETILLEAIGLKDFQPSTHPINVKGFKESFLSTGRLDAEYYQKKYEEILYFIENKTNWNYLKNLTNYISNGNQPPYSENGSIRFFSQKWIGDKSIDYSFLRSTDEPMVDKSFFENPKNQPSLVGKGDILYYSVGANLGFCHNYLEEEKIAVGSFINIIRADKFKINEIYLGVVLNSIIGRLQADREKSGIAQPYIYAKNLREFKIPIVSELMQKQIEEIIFKAYSLSKQSEQLLETVRRAVEVAIEEGEGKALNYLNDK